MSLLPDLDAFRSAFGGLDGVDLIRALAGPGGPLRRRTALVSAFGAESVVLLHMAAEVDPGLPVVFLDTGRHFPETLAYRDGWCAGSASPTSATPTRTRRRWSATTGTGGCSRTTRTSAATSARPSRSPRSWTASRPGSPAASASRGASGPASRRSSPSPAPAGSSSTRSPTWDPARIEAYRVGHDLPAHPLLARGYRSIGCAACTRPTRDRRGLPRRALVRHRQGRVRHPPAPALRRQHMSRGNLAPNLPEGAPFAPDEREALGTILGRASGEQRAWLAGYLAGIAAREAPRAEPLAPPRAAEPLLILYATESGQRRGAGGRSSPPPRAGRASR